VAALRIFCTYLQHRLESAKFRFPLFRRIWLESFTDLRSRSRLCRLKKAPQSHRFSGLMMPVATFP
jgi:hypothetical protein